METSEIIKKKLKKLKEIFPEMGEQIERELVPLKGEIITPKTVKKKEESD